MFWKEDILKASTDMTAETVQYALHVFMKFVMIEERNMYLNQNTFLPLLNDTIVFLKHLVSYSNMVLGGELL